MSKKKILLIEDNDLNIELFSEILESFNYKVTSAENAEKGIRLVKEILPDLILMDVQLPGMDGLTAIGILKNDPEVNDIPIVALSAYAMEKDKKIAKDAGCIDYITKPINIKNFINTIETILST